VVLFFYSCKDIIDRMKSFLLRHKLAFVALGGRDHCICGNSWTSQHVFLHFFVASVGNAVGDGAVHKWPLGASQMNIDLTALLYIIEKSRHDSQSNSLFERLDLTTLTMIATNY
jgi:hypothetical protein